METGDRSWVTHSDVNIRNWKGEKGGHRVKGGGEGCRRHHRLYHKLIVFCSCCPPFYSFDLKTRAQNVQKLLSKPLRCRPVGSAPEVDLEADSL